MALMQRLSSLPASSAAFDNHSQRLAEVQQQLHSQPHHPSREMESQHQRALANLNSHNPPEGAMVSSRGGPSLLQAPSEAERLALLQLQEQQMLLQQLQQQHPQLPGAMPSFQREFRPPNMASLHEMASARERIAALKSQEQQLLLQLHQGQQLPDNRNIAIQMGLPKPPETSQSSSLKRSRDEIDTKRAAIAKRARVLKAIGGNSNFPLPALTKRNDDKTKPEEEEATRIPLLSYKREWDKCKTKEAFLRRLHAGKVPILKDTSVTRRYTELDEGEGKRPPSDEALLLLAKTAD